MGDYEAFGRLESEGWSDSSRATSYRELFAGTSDLAINPLLDAARAKKGDRALDLCCGHGNVSEALKARGCAVSGLDFSPSMLDMARARVPDGEFVEADAQDLPFEEGDFDVVVSNFGICHVPDQPRALAEAHRVLRPSGRFAMTVWCGPGESRCFELIYGVIKSHGSPEVSLPPGPDFHQFAISRTATDMLTSAGFSDVRLSVVDCFFDLDEPERLCEIFEKGTVRAATMLASQPSERLSAIRSALAATVRERFAHAGRWRVPAPAALVSARK